MKRGVHADYMLSFLGAFDVMSHWSIAISSTQSPGRVCRPWVCDYYKSARWLMETFKKLLELNRTNLHSVRLPPGTRRSCVVVIIQML